MLIDLGFKFKELNSKEVPSDDNAAKVLAEKVLIGKTNHLAPLKAWSIATKFYDEGKAELDVSEIELLNKDILESNLTNLAKAQLVNYIKQEMLKQPN